MVPPTAGLAPPLASTSLLVIDVQQGFTSLCPTELPVPGGLAIVPAVNRLLSLNWGRVDASQDWHPPDHCSFFGQRDSLYPPHCVAGTAGAEFIPGIHVKRFQTVWRKGFERDRDAYAVTAQHPAFGEFLRASGIRQVILCGLAANICCLHTALDLRRAGFDVVLIEDASAGIDIPAANLFQEQGRAEGAAAGINYLSLAAYLHVAK